MSWAFMRLFPENVQHSGYVWLFGLYPIFKTRNARIMKYSNALKSRLGTAGWLTGAVALAFVPGCSSDGLGDVAGVNAYSQVSSEEVDKGKAAFVDKLYAKTPPPKAPGVRLPAKPKAPKGTH